MTARSLSRRQVRLVFLACLVLAGLWLAGSYIVDDARESQTILQSQAALDYQNRSPIVDPRPNITVTAAQASPLQTTRMLVAYDRTGRVLHYEQQSNYADVDPSPEGRTTVLVGLYTEYGYDHCPGKTLCSRQRIARINLTTGDRTVLYEHYTRRHRATNWHDVDRIRNDAYAVADIANDEVFIINTTTGMRTWSWNAQRAHNVTNSGGQWPEDWTHINDVEVLPDGRIMVSLRNHDQVVFLKPGVGMQEDWTLGCDDCHSILFEQHNPDYIPARMGGPAVLVADSENNRIIEYQRVNDTWRQSWVYADGRLDWPRDADRLPNGHTLITDSHEKRVIEINTKGEIVWQAKITNGYDSERLTTGPESSGGPSAVRANLTNVTDGGGGDGERSSLSGRTRIQKLLHSLSFILPGWVSVPMDLLMMLEGVLVLLAWLGVELSWRGWTLQLPVTRRGS